MEVVYMVVGIHIYYILEFVCNQRANSLYVEKLFSIVFWNLYATNVVYMVGEIARH